jgi:hypothetical protein
MFDSTSNARLSTAASSRRHVAMKASIPHSAQRLLMLPKVVHRFGSAHRLAR